MGGFGQAFQNADMKDQLEYLKQFNPSFAKADGKTQAEYLNHIHYSGYRAPTVPSTEPGEAERPAIGRELALGTLGTVAPESEHPIADLAKSLVPSGKDIGLTALTAGAYPIAKAGMGLAQQIYGAGKEIAPIIPKMVPGGGGNAPITKDEEEQVAHGVGILAGMAIPALAGEEEPVRPAARAVGTGIESTARFSRTPISDMSFRGFPVTPARLVGGMAGAKLGALSGQPEGVLAAGIGGVALGDRAAQGMESLGSKIKAWGGGEPIAPLPTKAKPIPKVPRPSYKGIVREEPEPLSPPPPLRYSVKTEDTATKTSTKPAQPPKPVFSVKPSAIEEQPLIIQPGEGAPSRIIAGDRGLYEGRARPAGDPMMWTNQQILDFAELGDPDAIRALPIRGLTMKGRPTSYENVPLPKK